LSGQQLELHFQNSGAHQHQRQQYELLNAQIPVEVREALR
jgi:hypothetical protein